MTADGAEPATLPPPGLPGLDPRWSRLVRARDGDGVPRTWHVLDTHAEQGLDDVRLTLLCVHGNPTWSYLWRRLLSEAPAGVRVVAVDHLDMGYSERTHTVHRLGDRVADLGAVSSALGIVGPVVTVAHDWGGPISLGWALAHRDQLRGIVLLNTAVHQPEGSPSPAIIRLARSTPLLRLNTVKTPIFVRGTSALSGRAMPRDVAAAFAAPYSTPDRRTAIGAFVADIPFEPGHPSAEVLDAIAEGIRTLDVPVLLLWGPGDPVFSDRYLNDLVGRLPHADVHRYEGARHLVSEDAPSLVGDLLTWVADLDAPPAAAAVADRRIGSTDDARERSANRCGRPWPPAPPRIPPGTALAEPSADGGWRVVSWSLLHRNVELLARGLAARGVRRGDRVSVLITPGADLLAVVYACWRIGASVVVTDSGLGVRGIHRALRGAAPRHVIAIPKGMALVRALRLPGQRIAVAELPAIARLGATHPLPSADVTPDDEAVVAFTSGSTGPAKGVVYRHRQVERTRDTLREHYAITSADALVAAFAPWAVLGPALGIASSIPDMDLTSPGTLTARAFADAVRVVDGTLVWASPAAFGGILDTASALTDDDMSALGSLRLVLGAGAPVSRLAPARHGSAVRQCRRAHALRHDRGAPGHRRDRPGDRRGRRRRRRPRRSPAAGRRRARQRASMTTARATGPLTDEAGVLGEVVVRAAHKKDRYDRLWATERASSRDPGWHRTGDVGRLDADGRLWIGGRLGHVITTPRRAPRARCASSRPCSSFRRCARRRASVWGPAGPRPWSSSSSPTTAPEGLADLRADRCRARCGRRRRGRGPRAPRASRRHPAPLQDRPGGAGATGPTTKLAGRTGRGSPA